jgi:Ca2+-transporting ATPase
VVQATPYIAGGRIVNFAEPCDYFRDGKAKASTLSLSVLVAIEMFNALNALSEVPLLSPICVGVV